jgi:hypothetical protein
MYFKAQNTILETTLNINITNSIYVRSEKQVKHSWASEPGTSLANFPGVVCVIRTREGKRGLSQHFVCTISTQAHALIRKKVKCANAGRKGCDRIVLGPRRPAAGAGEQ